MKIAIVILAVIGALSAGALGAKWLSDLSALGSMSQLERMAAQSMAAAQGQSLGKMQTAAFLLVLAFFVGLAGAFLSLRGSFALAGGLLVGAGILPVLFQPESLIATCLLVAAGLVAFFAHTRKQGTTP